MTEPYRLHYAPDNASLIIRLALEELKLPYTTQLVDRGSNAQRSPDYLNLNPAGRIPTLETPEGPISETGAILLWLADRHGGLLPNADDPMRGAALNWLFFIANTLHTEMIMSFYTHRYGPKDTIPDIRVALNKRIARHLKTIETEAIPRLGGWLGGERISALDLYTAAIVRWLQIYTVDVSARLDLTAYPRLATMCKALEQRPSVAALSRAEGMNDTPFTAPGYPNPPEGSVI